MLPRPWQDTPEYLKNNIKIHFHIIQLCTQPIYKTMDASKPLPAE
jgi:hypothetical protein